MNRFNNAHVGDCPVLWRHLLKVVRYSFRRDPWRDADTEVIEANFRADDRVQRLDAPPSPQLFADPGLCAGARHRSLA